MDTDRALFYSARHITRSSTQASLGSVHNLFQRLWHEESDAVV